MLKKTIIIAFAFLGLASPQVAAEDLRFPKTEAEFVEALSTGDKEALQTNTRGLTRGMNKRGVFGITPPSTPPKVGALINFDLDSVDIKLMVIFKFNICVFGFGLLKFVFTN